MAPVFCVVPVCGSCFEFGARWLLVSPVGGGAPEYSLSLAKQL